MPAAAVIRGMQALSGIIGCKASVGCLLKSVVKSQDLILITATETIKLELSRGRRNSECSGEMRRYSEEHRWRKHSAGLVLTLRDESEGREWD